MFQCVFVVSHSEAWGNGEGAMWQTLENVLRAHPLQILPLWHVDYFDPKGIESQPTQEICFTSPWLIKIKMQISPFYKKFSFTKDFFFFKSVKTSEPERELQSSVIWDSHLPYWSPAFTIHVLPSLSLICLPNPCTRLFYVAQCGINIPIVSSLSHILGRFLYTHIQFIFSSPSSLPVFLDRVFLL